MAKQQSTNPTNSIIDVDYNRPRSIMEELLASQSKKITSISRGQQVNGEVVLITGKEVILDIGAKSEGVLQKRELSEPQLKDLKLGSRLQLFVSQSENESGQVVLSTSPSKQNLRPNLLRPTKHGINWPKFILAQNQRTKLRGKVLEVNKGGLIVESESTRGFLPNSQVGFELLSKTGLGMDSLIGQDLTVTVIEVDQDNNKLIFSQRGQVSEEIKNKLKEFNNSQKVTGKIVAILPFGLVVSVKDRSASGGDTEGLEGLVFISDVSWEKVDDLSDKFKVGENIDVVVIGIDEDLGRLNLSIKQLSEDPFGKLSEKYPADEVIKAEVSDISEAGVFFKLEDDVEGFMPIAKIASDTKYEIGQTFTVLVDSIDTKKRRINLAPFITSTEGLIYK